MGFFSSDGVCSLDDSFFLRSPFPFFFPIVGRWGTAGSERGQGWMAESSTRQGRRTMSGSSRRLGSSSYTSGHVTKRETDQTYVNRLLWIAPRWVGRADQSTAPRKRPSGASMVRAVRVSSTAQFSILQNSTELRRGSRCASATLGKRTGLSTACHSTKRCPNYGKPFLGLQYVRTAAQYGNAQCAATFRGSKHRRDALDTTRRATTGTRRCGRAREAWLNARS